jgi:signal transduction histidine kinase
MYFSVRNIIQQDLQEQLIEEQSNFIYTAIENKVKELSSELVFVHEIQKNTPSLFSDSVLIVNDKYVLYRKLQFSYLKDDQYYRVSILKPQSQSDMLIMKIVIMNVGFAMLFFLIVFFVNRSSIRNALKVFYSTIHKLEGFQVNKAQTLTLDTAQVEEIKQLNTVFEKMSEQIRNDFEVQKEYTENVTHELQTPLSVISTKVDELMQADNLTKEQMEQLALLMETTNRLSKINKSLIFLTKIDNRFYTEKTNILLNDLINEKLDVFKEAIKEKNIQVEVKSLDLTHVHMDKYLAETMVVNLLKNAIIHNQQDGKLQITLSNQFLVITNSGEDLTFPESDIFKRFSRSEHSKKSLGIGLSIVKKICDLYNFKINYQFCKEHIFTLDFR